MSCWCHVQVYLSVEGLEVLPELCDSVPFADLNTEALLVCNVGGKPTEALAPAASHPNKQCIASGLHEHPVDVAHMQNCIPAPPCQL